MPKNQRFVGFGACGYPDLCILGFLKHLEYNEMFFKEKVYSDVQELGRVIWIERIAKDIYGILKHLEKVNLRFKQFHILRI